ncbi:MAG: ATP-binding protein [Bryobacteraceae bacterium]|nr:ATP-binding protein [Bryobacteraceae bacterium]
MRKRLVFGTGVVLLMILLTLIVWQTSFSMGEFGPATGPQTYIFWAVSTFIFLLTVALGFMLVRTGLRLFVERQRNREGSRIRTRLVVGALALSFTPVLFLVLFSLSVLNRSIEAWFSRPGNNIKWSLIEVGNAMDREAQARAKLLANLMALRAQDSEFKAWDRLCQEHSVEQAWMEAAQGERTYLCGQNATPSVRAAEGHAQAGSRGLVVRVLMPLDFAAKQREIARSVAEYDALFVRRKEVRKLYILLLSLITIFVLFIATWIARLLAQQISDPISAILEAAREVRRGNLAHRIKTGALDELGTLVRSFNQMTEDLESHSRELERRRRFTEAILESIPTGVISVDPDGVIQRYNPAVMTIFPKAKPEALRVIEDLLPAEEAAEIRYLMKRAHRTGLAARQFDFQMGRQPVHLSVTVSALEERDNSGFVLVIEDTGEMLRAQKAEAWHEVARRVAHEIKNPLTPIALCAERVVRQVDRLSLPPESTRILRECCQTILGEVESVKTLVNEFSQFARFPAAQPVACDLNDIVETALAVFHGRLEGIEIRKNLAYSLPAVNVDKEQFKRVLINLVDNAAEAMHDALLKRLTVRTSSPSPEVVELIVADTGSGISPEDKEKLFLPYFSTKGRGTGLGLAIVSHVLAEHDATIRVDDNRPTGARFVIEVPTLTARRPREAKSTKSEHEATSRTRR